MDVSIIIVNYNTPVLTGQAIDSVFRTDLGYTYKVFIVDNASKNNSVEQITEHIVNEPRCILLALLSNISFGKGNNVAIEQARRDGLRT